MIIWKRLDNTQYLLSNTGLIFSEKLNRELRPWLNEQGYLVISLWIDGEKILERVHRLVALVFHGKPEEKLTVNHKDGNKLNNHESNLEWLSKTDNLKHAWKTGLMPKGSESYLSVLKEEDVVAIKQMFAEGLSNIEITNRFPVGKSTISKIRQKQIWKHVLPTLEYDIGISSCEKLKKLTGNDIPIIRRMYSEGNSMNAIARHFNVHAGTISQIFSGKAWKNY